MSTEDPELAERFNRILEDVVAAMDEARLNYAFIGGVASGGLGRPRSTYDIDLFVHPEDAERTLRALNRLDFQIERTDPSWLYKAYKDGILVDVIFKSKGEIYYDTEMNRRVITAEFHGRKLRFVSPEDLAIIKAAAHSEVTPNHWHDAIALLSYANLDWSYLVWRARRAPRRILSLLLYAQSNDIWVPNQAVHELYRSLFGDFGQMNQPPVGVGGNVPSLPPRGERIQVPPKPGSPVAIHPRARTTYAVAHLREALAEDPRTNELDILIDFEEDTLLLRGEVAALDRKAAVEAVARELFPTCRIENQLRVLNVTEGPTEELK